MRCGIGSSGGYSIKAVRAGHHFGEKVPSVGLQWMCIALVEPIASLLESHAVESSMLSCLFLSCTLLEFGLVVSLFESLWLHANFALTYCR